MTSNKKAAQVLRKEAKYDRRLGTYRYKLSEAMALLKKQNDLITWLKEQLYADGQAKAIASNAPTGLATTSMPYQSSSDQNLLTPPSLANTDSTPESD